jgi:hypothetical protein
MNEFFARQMVVLRRQMTDYRNDELSLNALIQRIESIGDLLDSEAWNDAIFPIVLSMEQVNAVALDENRELTEADKVIIKNSLAELEALVNRFETV